MRSRRRIRIGYRNYAAPRRFSYAQLLIVVALVGTALYIGGCVARDAGQRDSVRVVSVADGDTIRVEFANGHEESVRLLGIDTPETHHPSKPVGCFGPEASNFTTQELDGQDVELEYDTEHEDKYDRTLAYVYLDGERFNDRLVREGYATILSIEPNKKYAHQLLTLEIQAKKEGKGLWGYCTNDN